MACGHTAGGAGAHHAEVAGFDHRRRLTGLGIEQMHVKTRALAGCREVGLVADHIEIGCGRFHHVQRARRHARTHARYVGGAALGARLQRLFDEFDGVGHRQQLLDVFFFEVADHL